MSDRPTIYTGYIPPSVKMPQITLSIPMEEADFLALSLEKRAFIVAHEYMHRELTAHRASKLTAPTK